MSPFPFQGRQHELGLSHTPLLAFTDFSPFTRHGIRATQATQEHLLVSSLGTYTKSFYYTRYCGHTCGEWDIGILWQGDLILPKGAEA